jgi:hypothetical protein
LKDKERKGKLERKIEPKKCKINAKWEKWGKRQKGAQATIVGVSHKR